jgi:integrase
MGVRIRGKRLVIDFRCYLPDGRKVRCVESEGPDTKENRKRVRSKWKAIQYHIRENSFNYLDFFPYGAKAKIFNRPKTTILFSDWFETWLGEISIRKSTESNYRSQFNKHFKNYFGHRRLSDIEASDIMVFRKILENTLKPNTINAYLKPLCQSLLEAKRRGLISTYPCEGIGSLAEGRPQIDPFSFDELRHLLDYLWKKDKMWHDLFLFWSRTGIRPGELYALKWEHIDYFNRKALIRMARKQHGVDELPKTRYSIRDVDLRPPVIAAIKRQEARTGLIGGYVFLNHLQGQFTAEMMKQKFRHWLKIAGLKLRPPKQMRHTFATLHIGAGESISWVSKMLGHADVETTLKKYNRFIPNLTREDGSAFEKIMDGKSQFGNNPVTSDSKSLNL